MFFVLIGVTHCFHMHTMLEKRVLSRLNSQFVYIWPATADDICQCLSTCLTIASPVHNGTFFETSDAISNMYINCFNDSVRELFGFFDQPRHRAGEISILFHRSERIYASMPINCLDSKVLKFLCSPAQVHPIASCSVGLKGAGASEAHEVKTFQRGSLYGLISCSVNWGRGLRFATVRKF